MYLTDSENKGESGFRPNDARRSFLFPHRKKSQHEMKASAQPHAPADPLLRKAIRELQWTRLIRCSTATRNSITGKKKTMTSDRMLSDSTVTAIRHVPLEKVNIAEWLLTLPDAEYQRCSHAHIAADTSTTDNGRTMSINVETIGDALIVQHYVAEVKGPTLCRMVSISDAINKNGRTQVKVERTLSARKLDDQTTEYTNHIQASATDEFIAFIQEHGITLEQAAAARQIASDAHNREITAGGFSTSNMSADVSNPCFLCTSVPLAANPRLGSSRV
jgi:hypothetical protein